MEATFGDLVWADDLATLLVCEDATNLVAQVGAEASARTNAFSERAMELLWPAQDCGYVGFERQRV